MPGQRHATLAFDVYGTLVDTAAMGARLAELRGVSNSTHLARRWREKQLEYTFRRGLMQCYADFDECTRQALQYACTEQGISMDEAAQDRLLEQYLALSPFPDTRPCLQQLKDQGRRLFALSNGTAKSLRTLLEHNHLLEYFSDLVSVDEIRTFKPDPRVYRHFLRRASTGAAHTWLISANPFDIIGARAAGWNTAWIQRNPATPFDPWESPPTLTSPDLTELPRLIPA